jgi:hypothetical protein
MSTQCLTTDQIELFREEGFTILSGIVEPVYRKSLIAELDEMIRERSPGDDRFVVSYHEMGMLTSYPPVVSIVEQLMGGTRFSMHHIHATRHEAGDKGIGWHQDYEQYPQTNRSHLMVHVFYYLSGLTGEIGDLLVVPKSQQVIVQRDLTMLGSIDLPGSVCIDDLEPGSAVIVHSGLWHARRPKPGGEGGGRYFVDVSYCQHGVLWPGYGRGDEINAKALEMGWDRDGRYAHLYDGSCFFDSRANREKVDNVNEGSLVYGLLNGDGLAEA